MAAPPLGLRQQDVGVGQHGGHVVGVGQIDERVDAGVDEHADLLPRLVNGFEGERVLAGEQSALIHPPGVHERVVRPRRRVDRQCQCCPMDPASPAMIANLFRTRRKYETVAVNR